MNKSFFLIAISASAAFVLLTAGIIRHDVNENDHLKLASEKQFDGVAKVYIDTSFGGSCVLIHERFLLSAAHVFIVSDFRWDTVTFNGQTIVINQPFNNHVVDAKKVSVMIKGRKLGVKKIIFHPNYLDSATKGSCDIALIELETPFKDVAPVQLNKDFDEMGFNVVGVGFGVSGIADNPETVSALGKKIAGENVIDSMDGFEYSGRPTILSCDFDHPTRTDCNRMGSATPRPLEYLSGGGDSGGGLFRQKGNQWELIGICSGISIDIQQILKTGYYGQIMSWTRVAAFEKWIAENVK